MRPIRQILLLLAVLCAACAHTPGSNTPPSVGFFARVHAHRVVRCVVDEDFPIEYCSSVSYAIAKINRAVGFELLHLGPVARLDEAADAWSAMQEDDFADHTTWVMGVKQMPPGVLGVTKTNTDGIDSAGYMSAEFIAFAPSIWAYPEQRESCVLHELFHSVGAGHADESDVWDSDMRAVWVKGAPIGLSPGDVTALRAAYPYEE
jgi:hypothetical protein